MSDAIYPMIAVCTALVSGAVILRTALTTFARVRRDRHMAEIQTKLLDRLGTAPDVMTYVNSESYRQLFESPGPARNEHVSRVLNGIQGGLVSLFAGIALFAISGAGFEPEGARALRVLGSIFTAIGLGLVVSTAWTHRMLRTWGLIGQPSEPNEAK